MSVEHSIKPVQTNRNGGQETVLQEVKKYPVGFFALLFRENGHKDNLQILLVKRGDFDIWNLPGGGGEPNETGFEAVKREVFEETGLEINPLYTEVFCIDLPRKKKKPVGAEVRADAFAGIVCSIEGGCLRCSSESVDIAWFNVGKLPEGMYERHAKLISAITNDEKKIESLIEVSKGHKFIPEGIAESVSKA